LKGLIVTADDFGAAREVNDAVETAHLSGILTSASLMVGAPAAADAVARARRMPSLRVGLHLVLVDGRPVLPADRVRDLVDESGRFRSNMAAAGIRMFFSPRARWQLAAEIEAQFEAFQGTGLPLDHVNAHKHFHLHPTIGKLMLRIGRRFGMRAARVPLEPPEVLLKIEPRAAAEPDWLIGLFARRLRQKFREARLLVPDSVFGVRWSGRMTKDRLLGLIQNAPDGLNEIYLHPATGGAFEGAAEDYRYREELAALTSAEVIAAARDSAIRLGGFADFHKLRQGDTVARASHATEANRSLRP
jgi:hopanoid biosynthesis associated protein HpnK